MFDNVPVLKAGALHCGSVEEPTTTLSQSTHGLDKAMR